MNNKQRKIKIETRIKMNYNKYNSSISFLCTLKFSEAIRC